MKTITKILKWILIFSCAALLIFICSRGYMYRFLFEYRSIAKTNTYQIKDLEFKLYIDSLSSERVLDINTVIDLSQKITSESLSYSLTAKDTDPNILFRTQSANCVGYAKFSETVANYLIEKAKIENWVVESHVAKISFLGEDVHKYIANRNFSNHDIVIFTNLSTKETVYIDPSLHDYFRIKRVSKISDKRD